MTHLCEIPVQHLKQRAPPFSPVAQQNVAELMEIGGRKGCPRDFLLAQRQPHPGVREASVGVCIVGVLHPHTHPMMLGMLGAKAEMSN